MLPDIDSGNHFRQAIALPKVVKAMESEVMEEVDVSKMEVPVLVETEPQFPGGKEAMYKLLGAHLKYPPLTKQNNIEGLVILSFIIEKGDSLSNVGGGVFCLHFGWKNFGGAARFKTIALQLFPNFL